MIAVTGTRRRRSPGRSQDGYTLMELLVAILIVGLLSTAVYAFFASGLDASASRDSQSRSQNTARLAIDKFTRDVRQAVSPDGLTAPVVSINSTSVDFWADLSRRASVLTPTPKRVRYQLSGDRLVKQVLTGTTWSAEEVLADPVANGATALFSATTEAGAATTSPAAVATISLRLILGDRAGRSATTTELIADATLRNRLN